MLAQTFVPFYVSNRMNISELARHLGVAVSTVSRVLSGNAEKYRISSTTVLHVLKAAEEFQVTPDPLGRGLRRGKPGMIGLLVPDITNPFFSTLARAIELRFRDTGIAVQLCDSAEDAETELILLSQLLSRRLDGLLLAPVGEVSTGLETAIAGSSMPIILLDRLLPGIDLPSVSLDNRGAGKLAATHLLKAGHRRIASLRGNPQTVPDRERIEGVLDAMADAGLPKNGLLLAGKGYTREESLAAAEELLSRKPRPTAIISLSGQGVLGTLEAARKRGLSIPGEVSLIAFDELPWSALMQPPITTIAQPVEAMSEKAAALLSAGLADPDNLSPKDSAVFEASLCERESVAPGAPREERNLQAMPPKPPPVRIRRPPEE